MAWQYAGPAYPHEVRDHGAVGTLARAFPVQGFAVAPGPWWPELGAALQQLPSTDRRGCPLCGCGEESAEHLAAWCPVAAIAWVDFGTHRSIRQTMCDPRDDGRLFLGFVHQLVFLALSLGREGATPTVARALGMLRRALRARAARTGPTKRDDDDAFNPVDSDGDEDDFDADVLDAWGAW